MAIGKREKIVLWSLVGLGAAAAVHFLIFKAKTENYQAALNRRHGVAAQVQQLRKPNSLADLEAYAATTDDYKNRFGGIMREFGMALPKAWVQDPSDPAVVEARWQDIYNLLDRLRQLRRQGTQAGHVKLTFLGTGTDDRFTWNFPTSVPRLVAARQANLFDILKELEGNYKSVLASQGGNLQFRAAQYVQYGTTMAKLDINYETDPVQFWQRFQLPAASLFDIYQQNGPPVTFLKTVEHARIYLDNAPSDLDPNTKALASRDRLMEILGQNSDTGKRMVAVRPNVLYPSQSAAAVAGAQAGQVEIDINLPLKDFGIYRQQLAALLDIIERADKTGIEEISFVKLSEFKIVNDVPPPPPAVQTPPPPPPGYGQTPAPVRAKSRVAFATPIEMKVRGSNKAVAEFLYSVTRANRPYELDSLKVTSFLDPNTRQATLTADITLNILAIVFALDATLLEPQASAMPDPMAAAPAAGITP